MQMAGHSAHPVVRTTPLALLWTAPALGLYGLFALLPLVVAVYLSCVRWNGLGQMVWAGAGNWQSLLTDGVALHAILPSLEMMVLTWVIETPLSLLLGVFMAGEQRYRSVLSVFYFVPLLFSTVALGITWVSLLDPNFGASVVGALSVSGLPPQRLELEVTESIFVRDANQARAALEQVMALGCGALRPLEGDAAELKRMYARPGGCGVGRALLRFLEEEARRLGYGALRLETRRVNARAVSFYERHGYARIPNYGRYAGLERAVCFEKRLDEGAA